jgi:hypothetical protein
MVRDSNLRDPADNDSRATGQYACDMQIVAGQRLEAGQVIDGCEIIGIHAVTQSGQKHHCNQGQSVVG